MKKKYIQLGIVAVLLIGMVTALLLLRRAPAPEEGGSAPAAEAVYVAGSADAPFPSRIDVANESGSYALVNRKPEDPKGEFTLRGRESLSLDNYGLGGAFTNAKAFAAKRVVTENAADADLETYGLKSPRATVEITNPDGGGTRVLIGNDAPGGEGAYVKRADDGRVYLSAPSVVEPFLKSDLSYINKTVTAVDAEQAGFDRLVLSGKAYPEPIVIERTPETTVEAAGMSLNTHRITSPIQAGVDAQKGLEPMAAAFGLTAAEVVGVGDDAQTLEAFGLTEPAVVTAITTAKPETTFTLRISETDADGNVTLIKNGSPVIYRLPASSLPWLGLTLFDFQEKMVILPFIDEVSAVRLILPGKTYSFALEGEGDDLKVTLDGKELPGATREDGKALTGADNFRQFYQTLISARYDEVTEDRPAEDQEPLMRIEYAYRGGKTPDVVSFYAGPTRRVFIALNDGRFYLTQSIYCDRVLEDIVKVAAGQPVKSYY